MTKAPVEIVKEWFEQNFSHRVSMTPGTPDHEYFLASLKKLEAMFTPPAEEPSTPETKE